MLGDKDSLCSQSVLWMLIAFNVALATAMHYRIIGGWSDNAGEYPYVVRLESEFSRAKKHSFHVICTGTLMTNQWVLTAAHCLRPNLYFVRYGNMTVPREKSDISQILKKIRHPNFQEQTLINDIGLLLIATIKTETTGKLASVSFNTLVGKTATVAGYGATTFVLSSSEQVKAENRPLQIGEGLIFGTRCFYNDKLFLGVLAVAPKCTERLHGAYYGDSGGPLLVSGKVVGVGSEMAVMEVKTFKREKIQYYTPVSPYLEWINDVIHQEKL